MEVIVLETYSQAKPYQLLPWHYHCISSCNGRKRSVPIRYSASAFRSGIPYNFLNVSSHHCKGSPFPTTIFSCFLEKSANSCLIDILWQQSAQTGPTPHIEALFNFQTYSCEDPGCPVWIMPGQNWKRKNKQTDPQLFSLLKDFGYFWTSMIPFANTNESINPFIQPQFSTERC